MTRIKTGAAWVGGWVFSVSDGAVERLPPANGPMGYGSARALVRGLKNASWQDPDWRETLPGLPDSSIRSGSDENL
jgi:hypothetical protein